jgi:hypothetical protein
MPKLLSRIIVFLITPCLVLDSSFINATVCCPIPISAARLFSTKALADRAVHQNDPISGEGIRPKVLRSEAANESLIWMPRHKEDEETWATADEISPGLWVGNADAARKWAEWGFTAILNVAPQEPAIYPPGVVYKKMGISDAIVLPPEMLEPLLIEGVEWALERIHDGHQLLIHCEEGAYRSPMVAIALMSVLYLESSFGELFGWMWGIRQVRVPPPMVLPIIQNLRETISTAPVIMTNRKKLDPSGPRIRASYDLRETLHDQASLWRAIHASLVPYGSRMPGDLNIAEHYPAEAILYEDFPPVLVS